MRRKQKVAEMADEVLARQAKIRADRAGKPLEEALEAFMGTEAGRQLEELRSGPLPDERAQKWQESLPRERADVPGRSSSDATASSPAKVPRRGPR